MLFNIHKNEYEIERKKLASLNTIISKPKKYDKKVNYLMEIIRKNNLSMIKLYTNINFKNLLLRHFLLDSNDNYIINFNNKKYNINIYAFGNNVFLIDCFHMNTITMQNYKKLILEIYQFIENTKIKLTLYSSNNDNKNNYCTRDNTPVIIFDNTDKLDINKIEIIYSLFSCKTIYKKNKNNILEIRYFLDNNNDYFYFNSVKRIYIEFGKNISNFLNNEINNNNTQNNSEYINLDYINKFLEESIIQDNKNNIYEFIQEIIKKSNYSFNTINNIYKLVLNKLIKFNGKIIKNNIQINKFDIMEELNNYYYEYNLNLNLNSLKHLVYENFLVGLIKINKYLL
jgi:hypothetical protein